MLASVIQEYNDAGFDVTFRADIKGTTVISLSKAGLEANAAVVKKIIVVNGLDADNIFKGKLHQLWEALRTALLEGAKLLEEQNANSDTETVPET